MKVVIQRISDLPRIRSLMGIDTKFFVELSSWDGSEASVLIVPHDFDSDQLDHLSFPHDFVLWEPAPDSSITFARRSEDNSYRIATRLPGSSVPVFQAFGKRVSRA